MMGRPLRRDVLVTGVMPHMHWLGKDFTFDAVLPDETRVPLIRIDDWDFNWQGTYSFGEPVFLPAGSWLEVVAHFDNSADNPANPHDPPRTVRWGDGTNDEMCIGIFEFVPATEADRDRDRRAHPDWVLGHADQIRGRQQLVLDMSNQEVRDYLYAHIADVLKNNDIGYIKWDHNRILPVVDARQAEGFYELVDRLRSDFPAVEIESCSSGGGRIDFGVLERTHRVWLSDSNDALERQRIQHDAALFLPASVTGSHVGPRHCHTSGRTLDIRLRAWTAAQRHMGFEMDPRELSEAEAETLRNVTSWWKANRDWMMQADILRLDSTDPAVIAEQQLAGDGSRFVAFAALTRPSDQILPRPLRLTGLDPQGRYRLSLVNRDEAPRLSRGAPLLKHQDLEASGQYLMSHGLTLPWRFPETVWVVEGERL